MITLNLHMSRHSSYYVWKALLPLYLVTALADASVFEFEPENLSDRMNIVSTFFLAAFAMLYVVGESLPKTEYLTKMGKVIILSTTSLVAIGILSLVLHRLQDSFGDDTANKWNVIF